MQILLGQFLILSIGPIVIRHYIRDTCFGGCIDKLGVCIRWAPCLERDDEKLLALEGRHEGGLIVVVDSNDFDAGRELTGAVFPGECCNGVFSGFEERFGEVLADVSSSLGNDVNCIKICWLL